jgi:hypothetical protein
MESDEQGVGTPAKGAIEVIWTDRAKVESIGFFADIIVVRILLI